MYKRVVALFVTFCVTCLVGQGVHTAKASYAEAFDAYTKQQYTTAFKLAKHAADSEFAMRMTFRELRRTAG